MASEQTIARVEKLVWILIYGGLFFVIVGIASMTDSPGAAWTLITVGGVLACAGAVLIWVRSRMSGPK